jgi:hypothetical protein
MRYAPRSFSKCAECGKTGAFLYYTKVLRDKVLLLCYDCARPYKGGLKEGLI